MRLRPTLIALVSALALSSSAFAGAITSTDEARAAAARITQPAASSPQQAQPLPVTSTDEARRAHGIRQQLRATGLAPNVQQRSGTPVRVTSTDEARVAARLL